MLRVTKEMRKAGERIASDLGGYRQGFMSATDAPNRDLILAYVHDEIDSVEAIYIAMDRAK